MAIVFAATNGHLDGIPVDRLRQYEEGLFRFFETRHPKLLAQIAEKKILDDEIKGSLTAAIQEFGKQFAAA